MLNLWIWLIYPLVINMYRWTMKKMTFLVEPPFTGDFSWLCEITGWYVQNCSIMGESWEIIYWEENSGKSSDKVKKINPRKPQENIY